MSTDLQHLLPRVRTHNSGSNTTQSAIATIISNTTPTISTDENNSENINTDIDPVVIDYNEEEGCKTPKSEEHRIPQLNSPPPAPRKKRLRDEEVVSCKKKLIPEFDRVIKVDYEEMEKFFKSAFDTLEEERKRQRRKVILKLN